jgi:hypothetical protein
MLDKLLARYLLACLPPYGPIRWHGPDTNRCTTRAAQRSVARDETCALEQCQLCTNQGGTTPSTLPCEGKLH